jgi:hypothetical protein
MDWKTFVSGLLGALIGAGAVVAASWFSYASKDEELRVHLVEIAIGILRAEPKEDVASARDWAMDAVDKYSGLRHFTPEERAALTHKPLGGAFPADPGVSPEWKKAFEEFGKDKFLLIPPEGFGKDGFVIGPPKEAGKDWPLFVPKAPLFPKDLTEPRK